MSTDKRFATITEDALAVLRSRIGQPIKGPEPYIRVATRDAIRHWALGIGDYNPLWMEPEYAAQGPYGALIGAPTMMYAFDKRASSGGPGLAGVHAMFAGTHWRWYHPVRENDEITVDAILKDVVERQGSFAGRAIQQICEVTFSNQEGTVVAVSQPYSFRVERDSAREKGKYAHEERTVYSNEELEEIWSLEESERPRGSIPRYYEDVVEGQELDRIVRGPLTVTDEIVFIQGWGGLYLRAHADWIRWYRRHQAGGIPNAFGVPEPPERVHWDEDFARAVGVPGAYDYGPQRIAWMGTMVTNWIGDAGWMDSLNVELRSHVLIGDTVWCTSHVTGKRVDERGRAIVVMELKAVNQRGRMVAKGSAEAVLPRKTLQ